MCFLGQLCEKWRPTVDLAGLSPRAAAGLRERKVPHAGALQSSADSSDRGEMAPWALEKSPFSAIFQHFSRFFPVFFRELAREGAMGRECDLELKSAVLDCVPVTAGSRRGGRCRRS